jgi:putative endonuclease
MSERRQHFGQRGEDLAARHLKKKGYKIIQRNYRTRTGEVDIIAKHKGCLVFIEVKTRLSRRYGHPKFAVTAAKQRKISIVALEYLKKNQALQTRARFDVVTVQPSENGPVIEIVANAFELAYG